MWADLPVHGPDDGRAESHPGDKADVEVFLQYQRLQAGAEEEERREEVTVPGRSGSVADKVDQQSGGEQQPL